MVGADASVVRETERKYEVSGKARLPEPGKLLGSATGGAHARELVATYFDTEDLRLLTAGITLRRRTGGSDEGWHLKLPAGPDSRDELQLPLGRSLAENLPPAELLGLVRVHTRGAAVAPVAELRTQRRSWQLAETGGDDLAELVDDQVVARTMGAKTTTVSWRELEVELAEAGSTRLLDRIEKRLLRGGATRSASSSKLAKVLKVERAATPAPVGKSSSAGEVVLAYLRAQADQLRTQDPLVRRDAPDSVHQIRVAARRMRSTLRAFGRVLDREKTKPLADELRWLGRALADDRDSEVQDERFSDAVSRLPDDLVFGPVHATLTRVMQRRQAEAREATLEALNSDRYLALQARIDELLTSPPLTRKARRPARKVLAKDVAKSYRRLERRMSDAADQPEGEQRDHGLHEARKAAKRARYAVETAAPAIGKPARRTRKNLKKIQSVLGTHQDTVVARSVLWRFGALAGQEDQNGFTYGVMHANERAEADRAERALPEVWKKATKKKTTKWLT
ncbi:CYTH and CHAD domain-containing protein [Pseudonocardia spinosispora]|uniref:CYTH and CHAD domain-containing protein n=1 Tax=Pseudonocardia spinosispora TaxID=103441 RepID=UPI0003F78981|nr:CYTH and CHAD domain-containing protein [Pseudonocardia spinosispora]